MKNRTFPDYWYLCKWIGPDWLSDDDYDRIMKMCRNAYNSGLREGKKKRPRAVKP